MSSTFIDDRRRRVQIHIHTKSSTTLNLNFSKLNFGKIIRDIAFFKLYSFGLKNVETVILSKYFKDTFQS